MHFLKIEEDTHTPICTCEPSMTAPKPHNQRAMQICPAHLALPLYKHLLAIPVVVDDLDFVDAELNHNLKQVRWSGGAGDSVHTMKRLTALIN